MIVRHEIATSHSLLAMTFAVIASALREAISMRSGF